MIEIYYLCRPMSDFNMPEKIIEESRQGEALMVKNTTTESNRKLYIESYGCQMNFSDSEIVASIMIDKGFNTTNNYNEADVVFINTCSIRENAEQRVRNRLKEFESAKNKKPDMIVGVLGCMAERLKSKFLEEEKLVDQADDGRKAVNVLLSREETYADIAPVRLGGNGVSAFVSIMRGCDNMCSFCVVPFTRGRERSRDYKSIVQECTDLFNQGYREVTLLGQNVDSYKWANEDQTDTCNFAELMERVALVNPKLRVRFSTSHPKDMTDDVLHIMAKYNNICKYIHLPVQSGNSRVLELMNRTYDRAWYINRVEAIERIVPDCAISTDVIAGFCTETEEEHKETLSLMELVKYDFAYMFKYSERPGTLAARKYEDDIAEEVKQRRLNEIIQLQQNHSLYRLEKHVGKTEEVLIEGDSKKSEADFCGRNTQNSMVVFPKVEGYKPGDYIMVHIERCTQATLIGKAVI
jgi:tRNA-2-methylthio-N6-dimethylallyladenosine synthase